MSSLSTKQDAIEALEENDVIVEDEDIEWWEAGDRPNIPYINRSGAVKIGSELGVDEIMIGGSRTEWLIASLITVGVDGGPYDYFQSGKHTPSMRTEGWISLAEAVLDE